MSVASGNGTGSLTATTAFTYDVFGNRLTVDGPLSGTADTTRARYDLDRPRRNNFPIWISFASRWSMEIQEGPTAPASGNDNQPSFEQLAADPEIQALLDFAPVPRQRDVEGGWTPERQREFIIRLAFSGSHTQASRAMGKDVTGIKKLYHSPHGESFRAAWDGAVAIAKRRLAEREPAPFAGQPPSIDRRIRHGRYAAPKGAGAHQSAPLDANGDPQLPGQVLNEYDEWEEEDSYNQRAEEAKDSVSNKLLRCRRMYLQQIADHPGKRAAFEILTEYAVDWDKARNLEEQDDEPYNIANQRQPDMVLTAQAGWLGDMAHGRNRMAEARAAVDAWRAEQGQPAVDWSANAESGPPSSP